MYKKLYETYLDIGEQEVSASGFISVHCPFHPDKKASAGFSEKTGVFKCFKCGNLSPAKFVQKVANLEYKDALTVVDQYRSEENLILKEDTFTYRLPGTSPKWERLYRLSRECIHEDLEIVQQYCISKNVSYEAMVRFGVGYLEGKFTHWGRESLVFPYTYGDKVVGLRYRDCESNKSGEPGCHFTLWGVDTLDEAQNGVCIVVEGETDRLAVASCLPDIPVVSTPTAEFRREWVREFEGARQVILIPQNDDASQKMVNKCQELLPSVSVINLPWRRRQWGKDVSDWLRYNQASDLKALVDRLVRNSPRGILTGKDLEDIPEEDKEWLVQDFLGQGELLVIAGQPKHGKTWVALNLVRAVIDPGELFCGLKGYVSGFSEPKKVLFVEEEGSLGDLRERARVVLAGTNWQENTVWMHRLGFRFDSTEWMSRLINEIERNKIDLLIVDPFQRTHRQKENDTDEMSPVLGQIAGLINYHRRLSIAILHHFNKVGTIDDAWLAFRGSSLLAQDADVGMFVQKRGGKGLELEVKIDGRAITPPDDGEVVTLQFDKGQFRRVHRNGHDSQEVPRQFTQYPRGYPKGYRRQRHQD